MICIAQLKEGYIKQVRSCENLADLFTKSLPNSTFQRLVHDIGMRRLKDLKGRKYVLHSFSLGHGFIPPGFPDKDNTIWYNMEPVKEERESCLEREKERIFGELKKMGQSVRRKRRGRPSNTDRARRRSSFAASPSPSDRRRSRRRRNLVFRSDLLQLPWMLPDDERVTENRSVTFLSDERVTVEWCTTEEGRRRVAVASWLSGGGGGGRRREGMVGGEEEDGGLVDDEKKCRCSDLMLTMLTMMTMVVDGAGGGGRRRW
ncbi:hypothetical protein OSB04_010918 [Centaurea solstitialis]|uniref:Uncharacterized protein n=1 Tax=Centaurea solstitialis TaxID=347529 RepID=A0AA38T8H0_9ASTR|nr:hypothetical protein OSB04_010918 [Centaurea solstitialis]